MGLNLPNDFLAMQERFVLPTYVGLNPSDPVTYTFTGTVLPTYVGLNLNSSCDVGLAAT